MFTQLKAAHSFLNLEALGIASASVSLNTKRQIALENGKEAILSFLSPVDYRDGWLQL